MPFRLVPSAAARTAERSQDSTGTASPQQPQRKAAFGNWHGWLSSLPQRNRKTPESSPLSKLSPDLLREVVKRTADADAPPAKARQLAVLRQVSKAFRDSADQLQQKEPAVHSAASEQRLAHAIREAVSEERRNLAHRAEQRGTAAAQRKKYNEKAKEIEARLAAVVPSLDPVIVDLRDFQGNGWLIKGLQDGLSGHPGNPSLEISARENQLLIEMTPVLDARPQLLRSLVLRFEKYADSPGHRSFQAKLSPVLAKQTNLAALRLENETPRDPLLMDLGSGGFAQAIASLPSLKSFAVCGYAFAADSKHEYKATTLLGILRELPALEDLALKDTFWDLAEFTRFASSLPALRRLQHLDLSNIFVSGPSETMHECVKHLAPVLPDLADLHTLDLTNRERLGPEDWSCLTAALARAPALKHLHLSVPTQPRAPGSYWANQVDPATLISILHPLAERQGLHIHMRDLDDARRALVQEALPALRISNE